MMVIMYHIKYLKEEVVGPYNVCLQKFHRGAFARYRTLVRDVFLNDTPSDFFASLKEAEDNYNKALKDVKEVVASQNKQFFLDYTENALPNNECYRLVVEEMLEDITVNIHSYRDDQHLYYGTVHFSRDKDRGIFYDLYAPITDTTIDPINEKYGDLKLVEPNDINEENKIDRILCKYYYDDNVGPVAFKAIVGEAINKFRQEKMPTPFDIRQKFLIGKYNEKDLDEAVKHRWISADQALKMVVLKAHLKMDDMYNKSKKE
jgi:hypothetical protein